MYRLVLIALGGAVGAVLRYLVQGWTQRLISPAFPLGTLVVNISGCLLIGFLGGLFFGPRPIQEDYRFAILVGLLGGYTTFSTFGWETMRLMEDGEFSLALLNVGSSVVVGLAAIWCGQQAVRAIYGL